MPPIDDPVARLHARAVFDGFLERYWNRQGPRKNGEWWPSMLGKRFDMYVMFESVRAMGTLEEIAANRWFARIRELMMLPNQNTNYPNAIRNNYERFCQPCKDQLEKEIEAVYVRFGYQKEHEWILRRIGLLDPEDPLSRAVAIRGASHRFAGNKSIDPEAHEESLFLSLPEAVQAVLRARLQVSSLEVGELEHPLFETDEPSMVLLDIRNHIIRMWYRDTRQRLCVSDVLGGIPQRYHTLGSRIFAYLECGGVINFGAIPMNVNVSACQELEGVKAKRVGIVGAGMAGLIAARQLRSFGFNVTVFEARQRPGGRVHTEKGKFSTGVDMGAMLITGVIQNPVSVLAHQTSSKMHFMDPKCPLYDLDGSRVTCEADEWAEKEFNAVLDAAGRYRQRDESKEKAASMSLGQAFQKALEKRARRRKARMEKHMDGAISCYENMITRERNPDTCVDSGDEDDDSYLEIPKRRGSADSEKETNISSPISWKISENRNVSGDNSRADRTRKRQRSASLEETRDFKQKNNLHLVNPGKRAYTGSSQPLNERLVSRLLRWHIANLEYACAASIDKVSLTHWDQDDEYGFSGEHVLLKSGYSPLVDGLVQGLENSLHFSSKVISVQYTEDGPVTLNVQNSRRRIQRFQFDSVLISVPLGVLKRKSITFDPPLPATKTKAIERLGFGGLVKVAMEFPNQFWNEPDMFGVLRESVEKRGEFYFFWNLVLMTGKPILVAVVAEPSVHRMESLPEIEVVKEAVDVLRRRYPEASLPTAYSVSSWSKDEFAGGAYTNIPVGSSGPDYDLLAHPVGKYVFFAGEHTCRQYPTTCASAIISGLREAHRIAEEYQQVEWLASLYERSVKQEERTFSNCSSNGDPRSGSDGDSPTRQKHVPFARKRTPFSTRRPNESTTAT